MSAYQVDATLLAIASHKPKHLVLCYTEKDDIVAENCKNIQEQASVLGLESIIPIPTSIEGAFLDSLLPDPEDNATITVNITPGSKGQGAELTLWAQEHGCIVWSIDNARRICVPINRREDIFPIPIQSLDPRLIFRCKGQSILEEGIDANEMPDKEFAIGILKCMRTAVKLHKEKHLFRAPLTLNDMKLTPNTQKGSWTLLCKGHSYSFSTRDGEWLERVTAMALLQIGAKYSRARMRLRWSQKNEEDIKRVHSDELGERQPHRLDLDVVGILKNDMILISCKAITGKGSSVEEINAAAKEVRCMGTSLGRFCLRMLMHMGCTTPYIYENSVMVFGWKELCQPELLRGLIKTLRKKKSTSA